MNRVLAAKYLLKAVTPCLFVVIYRAGIRVIDNL